MMSSGSEPCWRASPRPTSASQDNNIMSTQNTLQVVNNTEKHAAPLTSWQWACNLHSVLCPALPSLHK
eukprot:scaffold211911_cov15-Tisochrysis_lutea.AAC.1